MRILGIDPGTATTGIGVISIERNNCAVIDFGLIETNNNSPPGKRLVIIHRSLSKVLKTHKPDVVAIEKLFFATNAKTAMRVGQAQGVMLYSAEVSKIKVYEYAPGTIKKTITGDGRADKRKMQRHLRSVLGAGVRSRPKKKTHFDNAADALAVALCHAYVENLIKRG